MKHIFAVGGFKPPRALGATPGYIATAFTTDGSGDPTLVESYSGQLSITRSEESGEENYYTIQYPGSWGVTQAVLRDHTLQATVNSTPVPSPSGGSCELQFSGAIASARVDVVLFFSGDSRGG